MRLYTLGAVLLSAISVSADEKHDCYWRRNDQIVIKDNLGWFQCNNTQTTDGGAQLCCKNGDRCGDDSICHSDDLTSAGSSFYVGGCSDRTYNDPVCRSDCTSFKQTYIQWNNTQHLWDCCGDYSCDGNYTSESFKAVSPAEWEPIPQGSNFNPDNDDGNDDNGIELSTAAKAGIGVGAGVAVIAIVALIAVCCIRRRKPANSKPYKGKYAQIGPQHEMASGPFAGSGGQRTVSPMPRSRNHSPTPASRGVSPSRDPLVAGYGDGPPTHVAAQSASMYPDRLAAQRSTDDGA